MHKVTYTVTHIDNAELSEILRRNYPEIFPTNYSWEDQVNISEWDYHHGYELEIWAANYDLDQYRFPNKPKKYPWEACLAVLAYEGKLEEGAYLVNVRGW